MKLYSYEESGNSYKVRLLCALLGIAYEKVEIDLMQDEQHRPDYLAVNPHGEVPTLVDGALCLRDSAAILMYLAAKHAPGQWWPTAPAQQAEVIEWLAFAASWIQYGVFTVRAIHAFGISANGVPHEYREDPAPARLRALRSLEILDAHLAPRDWLACGRPTIADLAVFPYVALAPMGEITLAPYSSVLRWIGQIRALPGFVPIAGLDDPSYRGA